MEYATLIRFAELAGVCVFSITGALAAQGKRMDILGVVVLAIVTALGGGTIRDITLNAHPIGWVVDNVYLWTAIISAVIAFIACRRVPYPRRTMLVLDAAGLALFAILGAEKAQALGASPGIVVMMACITGCAGGMIRDMLTREIPMILHRDGELYATCALVGAVFYVVLVRRARRAAAGHCLDADHLRLPHCRDLRQAPPARVHRRRTQTRVSRRSAGSLTTCSNAAPHCRS